MASEKGIVMGGFHSVSPSFLLSSSINVTLVGATIGVVTLLNLSVSRDFPLMGNNP